MARRPVSSRHVAAALALIVLLAACVCGIAQAQSKPSVLFTRLPTGSPVVFDRLVPAGHPAGPFNEMTDVNAACVTFHDTDARTATSVRIEFVYYDRNGQRAGGDLLTRNGKFSTNIVSDYAENGGRVNMQNCVVIHVPPHGISVVSGYIDRVDFADGTSWQSTGVTLPDHIVPGTRPRFVEAPVVQAPANAVGLAPAATNPMALDPLILASYPTCAAALASTPVRTPSFAGLLSAPHAADGSVYVEALPGTPAGNELFHIGNAAVCAASSDPERDAAAIAVVKQLPATIRSDAAYRVFFPVITASPVCNVAARLFYRQVDRPVLSEFGRHGVAPGVYNTIVRVVVGTNGRPHDATLVQSSGTPELDEEARSNALGARYWPSLVDGAPVSSTFDYQQRWTIVRDGATTRTTIAASGPVPPPPSCLP